MHPIATNRLLNQHLKKIEHRIDRYKWKIGIKGEVLFVEMYHRPTRELYHMAIVADEYPLVPVAVHFLPVAPRVGEAKWPFDGHFVFRTNSNPPFICLGGVRSFIPEALETTASLGMDEINIGAVLTNIDRALHDPRYSGPVYLRL